MSESCAHRKTWFIVGDEELAFAWCYECGAWRQMRKVGPATLVPVGNWHRPVGKGGENPTT